MERKDIEKVELTVWKLTAYHGGSGTGGGAGGEEESEVKNDGNCDGAIHKHLRTFGKDS